MTQVICGVDVSSISLDAFVGPQGPARSFANSAEGIAQLAKFCIAHEVKLVAMEASGGYEKKAFGYLWGKKIAVAVLNPREVRQFAKAMGSLEKTDRIDARIIARFAEAKGSQPTPVASPTQERLKALAKRLQQLAALTALTKNQRSRTTDATAKKSIAEILEVLQKQMREFENKIEELLSSDPLWAKLVEALRSIKGVAGRTVARVMAELPEIGALSKKAVSKLVGLAPMANDSGKHEGRRAVRGGRRSVRSILYLVAGVVRRHNREFAEFSERLAARGKRPKVIRIALAHKLLVKLNARARDARRAFASAAVVGESA